MFDDMRVAIVSDPMSAYGGAERVLEQIIFLFPDADLFALADHVPADQRGFLGGRSVCTSFIQDLPGGERFFRKYILLWPQAIEQFDLSNYDLVISSHHCVAHGALTGPKQLHLVYSHSPMRYAWDMRHEYLEHAKLSRGLLGFMAQHALCKLRQWDMLAGQRAGAFMANSAFVAARLKKYYNRDAEIIYPPVEVGDFKYEEKKEKFFLAAGRLVSYKRFDLLVQAFKKMPSQRLIVVGAGPELKQLRALAGPNVTLLGYTAPELLRWLMAKAQAFLFSGVEDFGIAPLEAQASGTPVICLGYGGLSETIRGLEAEEPTGVYFREQTVDAIVAAIDTFQRIGNEIRPQACRSNALRFSVDIFRAKFAARVIAETRTNELPFAAPTEREIVGATCMARTA
jgi:glycosyltransferase involved in cell wall biosynthesis